MANETSTSKIPGDIVDLTAGTDDHGLAELPTGQASAMFSLDDSPRRFGDLELAFTIDDADTMILDLEDLFPDENGEIVISTADGLPINLLANLKVDQSGVADDHVTATGIDVSGLHFHTFEGGLTIYFEHDDLVKITDMSGV